MELKFNVYNYNRGTEAFKEKKYEESINFYNQAIQDNPLMNFSRAIFWRGISYFHINKFQEAINDFEHSQKNGFSDDFRLYYWRGLCYFQLQQFVKAVNDFQKSTILKPDFIESFIELYVSNIILENRHLGDDTLNKILSISPNDLTKIIMCGNKYYEKNFCELAIKIYTDILRRVHDEPNCLQGRAFCFGNMGKYEKAICDLDRLIQIDRVSGTPYFNRGMTYLQMNEKTKANLDFKKAYELGVKQAIEYIK